MRSVLASLLLAASISADVPLHVRETAGVTRASEVLSSGIPLPKSANVKSTSGLSIVDANGVAIPAEFRVLARWNAGRTDAAAPIQWLLVTFAASVPANGETTYRLVTNGANPAPASPLRLERNGNRVTVDTGAATFVIDADSPSLFESGPLIAGSALGFGTLRSLKTQQGPLTAVVTVSGTYGSSDLATQRRYVFTAGSSTAIVRQTLVHETPSELRIGLIRDRIVPALTPPFEVTATGARGTTLRGTAQTAFVQQKLRSSRTAAPRFDLAVGSNTASGAKADGALLSIRGAQGTLSIALDHIHRYEPQALRLLEDGSLAIDLVAEQTWLGSRQGLFANFAVGTGDDPLRTVWAPLNHPLRAWPDASAFSDFVPRPGLPSQFADYDTAMRQVLERTIERTDDLGVYGLMTFGLFPRAWGDPLLSDEIDCFGGDPTPSESWDNLYWCSTWTDYHNASYAAAAHAMRTGEVQWLDEISRPAALRMLFTQIQQCSPDDGWFYCGQAPAGYGGYRDDFNSSHAYFDNLFLHYWLTGDEAVVETLQRGATSMRNYLCTRRPASACGAHDPPVDEWANLTGRVASQWFLAFRFAGLASDDASFLDDWRSGLARAFTQQYVNAGGYGFVLGGWQPVTSSGTKTTDQLWMTALYDMKSLDILRRDTNDAPIGDPPIRPSEIITAYARTLARYGGPLSGDIPNSFDVTWTGPRIGGTLVSVRATPGGGDPLLYETGKATLAGPLAAAASFTNDAELRALATDAANLAIRASIYENAPLGKIQAEFLARLHEAIAALSGEPTSGRRRRVRH